ncbi:hypothetical protein NE865_00617 [Phthorimaea operculella]|nr:hypothetical protein NE865_00617 [Phthorimaea operculella]
MSCYVSSLLCEDSVLENGCPVDPHIHWLQPHESECNLFYYCVWGRKELRECSASLHFNRVLQWTLTSTGCCLKSECNLFYYCVWGRKELRECSASLHINRVLQNDCLVDPHIHWLLPHESECNLFYYCVWGRKELRECSASLHFNRVLQCNFSFSYWNEEILFLKNGCPVDPHIHWLQPHESECNLFYYCVWGRKELRECSACRVDPHIHWLLPHESECNLFYYCVWGRKELRECSASLHFNRVLQVSATLVLSYSNLFRSLFLENGCAIFQQSTPEETPSTPMISASHRRRPALACLTDVILRLDSALKNGCPVDPHIHWLLPQESECNLFYYCVWGRKELRECSASLHFNKVLQFLKNSCLVDPHIHWLLPHESECNLFYYCVWGRKELRECSASLHFNRVLQCLKVLFSSSGPSHPLAAASRVRVQPLLLLRVVTQGAQGVFRVATLQQSAPGVEVQPPLQQTASGQCHFSFSHWNKEIEFLENGCPVDPHIHWLLPEVGVQPLLLLRVGTQGAQGVFRVATLQQSAPEETPSTPMISASHRRRPALACLTDVILRLDSALKNGCPVDPHIHWLLPQESECNLFYYCVWGRKELRECSASLHFNKVLQVSATLVLVN